MNATDFTYNGQTLSSFGMIPCSFTGHEDDTILISSVVDYASEKPFDSYIWDYYGGQYSEPLTITITIGLDPCVQANINADEYLWLVKQRVLAKWLNPRQGFKELIIPFDDHVSIRPPSVPAGTTDIYFYAHCTRMEAIRFGGHCIGFEVEFTTNAPFGFGEERTIAMWRNNNDFNGTYFTKTIDNVLYRGYSGTLQISDDALEWLYPKIIVQARSNGKFYMNAYESFYQNDSTPPRSLIRIDNVYTGEVIEIDKRSSGVRVLSDVTYTYKGLTIAITKDVNTVTLIISGKTTEDISTSSTAITLCSLYSSWLPVTAITETKTLNAQGLSGELQIPASNMNLTSSNITLGNTVENSQATDIPTGTTINTEISWTASQNYVEHNILEDFHDEWIHLVDGKNTLAEGTTGNTTALVSLIFREPRKVGV